MLFYSRGGSIPRGGGRIDALLRAAPAESVSGVLRFTEQGEGIAQNFGLRANAMRTLERAFNTLALATLAVRRGATTAGKRRIYRGGDASSRRPAAPPGASLLEGPGFFEFFRAVTPIDVIERMRIGAVQRRESAGGAEHRGRAGRGLGVRLVAVAAHAARLVWRRLRARGRARRSAARSCCARPTPSGRSSAA